MLVLGIDPGKSGALFWLHGDSSGAKGVVMPEHPQAIVQYLKDSLPDHIFLEKAQAMPKNGAVSMFNYGEGYGTILGILIALKLSFTLVRPATWTKLMHLGTQADVSAKERSLLAALRLFPNETFIATPRSKKPHEGLIDAALIAEYGRRTLLGKTQPPS